jgi:hypothetical protein
MVMALKSEEITSKEYAVPPSAFTSMGSNDEIEREHGKGNNNILGME